MKKIALASALVLFFALALSAQSLMDNSFYLTGTELASKAQEAYDLGDYDAAADYAAQAEEYFIRSDEYVAMMILYQDAQAAVDAAEAKLEWATSVGAGLNYSKELAAATEKLAAAKAAMAVEDYNLALSEAKAALESLALVKEAMPLPATYVVQYLPNSRDCFWRIAGLPWAYNDPFQWTKLYQANKKRMIDPNNPDLILPGQVISIPSLYGEKREGSWDPKKKYEPLKKPAKAR